MTEAKAPIINKPTQAVKKAAPQMKDYVNMMMPEIKKVLPTMVTPERFTRITLNALSTNPKLAECTPKSFLGAMMNAAQAGLEPNTPLGEAYLIPFKNKGTLECQFQIGYKGMIALAHRAGTNVDAHVVYENDIFEYEYGLEPKLKHIPALKDRGEPIAYYGIWKNGDTFGFIVMSHEDIRKHARKYSKGYESGSSPWQTDFEAMAKKTVLKQALKYAPLAVEEQRIMTSDETIKSTLSENMADAVDETDYSVIFDGDTGEVISDGQAA